MTEKVFEKVGNILKHEEEHIEGDPSYGGAWVPFYHEQEVTIAASGTTAATDANFVPAHSWVFGGGYIITQAPGGGATLADFGRTNGSNLDEFIDGASCDVLGETANTTADRAADVTAMPLMCAAADTCTLTVNSAVTGASLKARVAVWGFRYIEPSLPS